MKDEKVMEMLADKIIALFDGFGLLPRDMNKNDKGNLRNAKYNLIELLNHK